MAMKMAYFNGGNLPTTYIRPGSLQAVEILAGGRCRHQLFSDGHLRLGRSVGTRWDSSKMFEGLLKWCQTH